MKRAESLARILRHLAEDAILRGDSADLFADTLRDQAEAVFRKRQQEAAARQIRAERNGPVRALEQGDEA